MADNPAPIIQEIIIRQQGVDAANRAIGDLATRERDAGRAAADAGRATDAAARATTRAGQAAAGARGPFETFKRSMAGASSGLGAVTQGVQIFGGALGALVGGGAIGGALGAAWKALSDLGDMLGITAPRFQALTEETVKAATGIADLSSGLDQYAVSIGKASAKSLTFLENQRALSAVLLGGSTNRGAAAAKAEADSKEIIRQTLNRAMALTDAGRSEAESLIRFYQDDLKKQETLQTQFIAQEEKRAEEKANAIKRGARRVVRARLGDTGPAFGPANLDFGPVDNPGERARLAARDEALLQERYALQSAGVDARSALSSGNKEPAKAVESQLQGLATTAADTTSIAIGAFNQLTAAFGQTMAQMVISGELGAGGLRKSLGRIIGGVSETLFTYGTLASLLAIASPLSGGLIPGAGLGPVAAGLFAGAVATGLIARSLGAGASAGGAGGRVAGAGAGGVGGGGVAPVTNISINLGISSRAVHDAVVQESSNLAGARGQRRVAVERAA